MVGRDSGTIDLVEPIYVVVHQVVVRLSGLTGSSSISAKLVACEDLHMLEHGTEADVTIVGHFQFLTGFTLLGRDQDDTIRRARTIYSSSRRILQYGEGLDIVRVNQRQRVGHTLDTIVIHCQTVDDDQRVVGSVQRRSTTDTDRCSTTRGTTIGRYVHTGDLTLDHVLGVGLEALVHIIGLDSRYRTGSVVFLNNTIADYNDLVQHLGILAELYLHHRLCCEFLLFVSHIGDGELGTIVYFQYELTVEVGDRTVGSTNLKDGGTNDRFSIRSINYFTLHGHLRKSSSRSQHHHERKG